MNVNHVDIFMIRQQEIQTEVSLQEQMCIRDSYHTVSFLYLLYQTIDLFAIRKRLFVSQLIRRTAGSIDRIVPGIIHLGLHDQIIIEVHCHHSFQVGVIFILTSNHLSILLCHCQYVVIMKITSKQKGDQTMKYHTKLEGMLLQRYGGLIFRNSSIWDKNSSVRYAEKELSHKRRELKRGSGV